MEAEYYKHLDNNEDFEHPNKTILDLPNEVSSIESFSNIIFISYKYDSFIYYY